MEKDEKNRHVHSFMNDNLVARLNNELNKYNQRNNRIGSSSKSCLCYLIKASFTFLELS